MYDKLVARAARAKAVQKAKSGRRPVSVYDRYQTRDTNGAPTHQDRNKTRRESLAMHACIKLSLREEPSSQESGAVSGAADDRPRHIPPEAEAPPSPPHRPAPPRWSPQGDYGPRRELVGHPGPLPMATLPPLAVVHPQHHTTTVVCLLVSYDRLASCLSTDKLCVHDALPSLRNRPARPTRPAPPWIVRRAPLHAR